MRTLSGGEAQRISLATQLGSKLTGTLYVLDEPTIGLHPRDTAALANLLKELAKNGNTVVTVEHDHHVIQQANHVVEMGPASGEKGGEVVCSAPYSYIHQRSSSDHSSIFTRRRIHSNSSSTVVLGNGKTLTITGAHEHNLKNLDRSTASIRNADVCHRSIGIWKKHARRKYSLCSCCSASLQSGHTAQLDNSITFRWIRASAHRSAHQSRTYRQNTSFESNHLYESLSSHSATVCPIPRSTHSRTHSSTFFF